FHLQEQGARGVIVSAVGDDADGDAIRNQLSVLGLSDLFVARNSHPTGTVTAVLDPSGKATYTIHEDVAWDSIPFSEDLTGLAKEADAVCFGSLAQRSPVSKQTIQDFLNRTSARCLRVFDINLRQSYFTPETIQESLTLADVFKLNDEELPVLQNMLGLPVGEEDALSLLRERYDLSLIALTRGGSGSLLYTKSRTSRHPGFPLLAGTRPDTIGAGDSFTATLVRGLLNFEDLDRIHDRANRVASFVCSQPGGTPRVPAYLL
ncbi:MAG: PfkB family carbohydrate kinase, partial [Armatimonadota bacterium]